MTQPQPDHSNVLIVAASHRAESQSLRIAHKINQEFYHGEAQLADLFQLQLPLWDGESTTHWASPALDALKHWQSLTTQCQQLVLVVPEWHGSAPAALKNALQWCQSYSLAHKPCLLVAISASAGGAFAIADVRATTYKNSRLLILPEHIILRDVDRLWVAPENLAEDLNGHTGEQYLHQRLGFAIQQLATYANAMTDIRPSLLKGLKSYPNGMS